MKLYGNALLLTAALIMIPTTAESESFRRSSSTQKILVANENQTDNTDNENQANQIEQEKLEEKINELLPDLSEEKKNFLAKLTEADQIYQAGEKEKAQQLYQQAKSSFYSDAFNADEIELSRNPYHDAQQLPPGGSVYWGYGEEKFDPKLRSRSLSPLSLLVEKYPDFIPGHVRYAEALAFFDQTEKAITHLETTVSKYPEQVQLVEALLPLYKEKEQWLDASLVARQFALFNSEHEKADEFKALADNYLENYNSQLRSELRGNAIANIITGGVGFAVTGGLMGPLSAINTTRLLLQGESDVGQKFAERFKEKLPIVEDQELNEYVNDIGTHITQYAGRDEFNYEFYIVENENVNAFALPGGKIFINSGAILKTSSEAELAGLIAHELSHVVLSHGFQLMTEGNLLANVGQLVPFGGTAANLVVLDYSRDMEREADELGTQLLASSKYAADGMYNLMRTLDQQKDNKDGSTPPAWLSTHPETAERINHIKTNIINHNYNIYTFEGVQRHQKMQKKVAKLLAESKLKDKEEKQEQEQEEPENRLEQLESDFPSGLN